MSTELSRADGRAADAPAAELRDEAARVRTSPQEGVDDVMARFAAAVGGALTLHFGWQFWTSGKLYVYHEIAAMDLLVYTLAFGLFWLALLRGRRWSRWIGPLVLIAALLTASLGTYVWVRAVSRSYGTDVLAFEHYATRLVLHGADPYPVSMRPALQEFHVPLVTQTQTWNGRPVDRFSYPAGAFLIFAPFAAVGVGDLRWIVLLFHLATIGVVYLAAPSRFRVLALLPMLASPELVDFTGGGVVDFPWVLALLLVIVWERRPALAGVCYGLACSLKQEPWFLAPFLAIYFFKGSARPTKGERFGDVARFAIPAAGLFLILNGPFLLHDPVAWVLGTVEPALGNLIPLGQGPSTFVELGIPLPIGGLTVVAAALGGLLVLNYLVYFRRLRDVMWLFPVLITWFMPRSLHNYFVFWIPAMALVVARRATVAEDSAADGD